MSTGDLTPETITGSFQWQLLLPNVTIIFNSLDMCWPLLPDWWPSLLGDLHLWNDKEWHPAPCCITPHRRSQVWHMVPFHAWQESVREAHHCYCQIGPAVYSSITPSSLTVTGHQVLYINSDCDIDLFPVFWCRNASSQHPFYQKKKKKERLFSVFSLWFLIKILQTLQSSVFVLSRVGLVVVFQPCAEMLLAARGHACIL